MSFSSPIALLLALLAVPAAVALFAFAASRRREALALFAAGNQVASAERTARRRRWQAALLVGAVGLLGIAAAGPRYGTELRDARQEGVDLIIALDVSTSMLAEDVAPSRLLRARYEVERVLGRLAGSRVGLVLFAGEAFLQCPLTTDLSAVRLYLGTAAPDLIPTQGTDLAEALHVATQAFDVAAGGLPESEPRARVLLVISDGEDHPDRYDAALRAAEEAGIAVFTAGVGTPEGGRIPMPGAPGRVHTDRTGAPVVTRLDDGTLRRLARSGAYYPVGRAGDGLDTFPEALTRLDRTVLASDRFATYAEQYQWPLGLALVLLAAERLLGLRRRTPQSA